MPLCRAALRTAVRGRAPNLGLRRRPPRPDATEWGAGVPGRCARPVCGIEKGKGVSTVSRCVEGPGRSSGGRVVGRMASALVVVALLANAGAAQGVADLVERARPAVAIVVARAAGGLNQGTGFVYDPRGFLLTAAHVVEGASEVTARLPNRRPMVAVVAQVNQTLDVAALRVGEESLPFIRLATGRPRVGEEVVVLGYPLAQVIGFEDLTVTRGIVSRLLVEQGLLQFDASVNPGNSGGPVLNSRGEAVGVVVGRVRGATGINFAVLSEAAQDVARLALQVPFAPASPPAVQTPRPAPAPTVEPAPRPSPGPGEWRLIGSKGPTPRNREIRTPVNLAIREARYRVEAGVLFVQVELYERPTGDARIQLFWRLPGAGTPAWALLHYMSSRRTVFGRYVLADEVRRFFRVDPREVPGIRVNITGSFVDIAVPLEALQPRTAEWEVAVVTAYLGRDDVYWAVDWLPWTRITL